MRLEIRLRKVTDLRISVNAGRNMFGREWMKGFSEPMSGGAWWWSVWDERKGRTSTLANAHQYLTLRGDKFS